MCSGIHILELWKKDNKWFDSCLFIFFLSINISIYLPLYLFIYLCSFQSIHQYIHQSIYLGIGLAFSGLPSSLAGDDEAATKEADNNGRQPGGISGPLSRRLRTRHLQVSYCQYGCRCNLWRLPSPYVRLSALFFIASSLSAYRSS